MENINILIVDDHQLIINGISDILRPIKNYKIIGNATNGKEAIAEALKLKPDIIFMDISMPIMNGLDATKIIAEKLPNTKILALTQHEEKEYVNQIFNYGGSGYLLKNSKKEEFVAAIESVMSGNKYLSKHVSDLMLKDLLNKKEGNSPEDLSIKLTPREKEIIKKIAEDLSNQEIADKLFISLRTVETHRRNLMQKLKVKSVVSLLKYAAKHNIIKFDKD